MVFKADIAVFKADLAVFKADLAVFKAGLFQAANWACFKPPTGPDLFGASGGVLGGPHPK